MRMAGVACASKLYDRLRQVLLGFIETEARSLKGSGRQHDLKLLLGAKRAMIETISCPKCCIAILSDLAKIQYLCNRKDQKR